MTELHFSGRIKDAPLFEAACDLLGIDSEETGARDRNAIQEVFELVAKRIGSDDELAILEFIRKAVCEIPGDNKHRFMRRILLMCEKNPKKEILWS